MIKSASRFNGRITPMKKEHNNTHHITLLRHGESVGNAEGYHQGQTEFHLTEKGRSQVQALAGHWQSESVTFDQVIASPQSRARETVEVVAGALGLDIEFDPVWMERDNGVLGGLRYEEAAEKYPQPDFIPTYAPIGRTGESLCELYLRGGRAIQSLLHRQPGRYLIVSHGGLLNMVMYAVLGITPMPNFHGPRFRFQNTAFATLGYHPSRHVWYVHGVNQRPHWDKNEVYP